MNKNNNKKRTKITDIKINPNSIALYNVEISGEIEIPMTPKQLADYVNETSLKNLKDKKLKNNE